MVHQLEDGQQVYLIAVKSLEIVRSFIGSPFHVSQNYVLLHFYPNVKYTFSPCCILLLSFIKKIGTIKFNIEIKDGIYI